MFRSSSFLRSTIITIVSVALVSGVVYTATGPGQGYWISGLVTTGTASGSMGFWNPSNSTTTAPDMLISTGGNIGIGTIAPTAKLEVIGNAIAATPTAANHLTTKAYVDAAVSAAGG